MRDNTKPIKTVNKSNTKNTKNIVFPSEEKVIWRLVNEQVLNHLPKNEPFFDASGARINKLGSIREEPPVIKLDDPALDSVPNMELTLFGNVYLARPMIAEIGISEYGSNGDLSDSDLSDDCDALPFSSDPTIGFHSASRGRPPSCRTPRASRVPCISGSSESTSISACQHAARVRECRWHTYVLAAVRNAKPPSAYAQ